MSTLLTNFMHLKKDDAYKLCYSADMYKTTSQFLTSPITVTQMMTEVYNRAMSIDSSLELYRPIPTDNSLICVTGASPGGLIPGGIFCAAIFYLFGYTESTYTLLSNFSNIPTGVHGEITNRNPNLVSIDPGDNSSLIAIGNFEILYLSSPNSFFSNYLDTIFNDFLTYYSADPTNNTGLNFIISFWVYPVYDFVGQNQNQYSIWYTLAYPNSINYETSKIVLTYNNNTVEFETLNDHIYLEQGNSRCGVVGNNDEDGAFPVVDEDEYINTDLDYLTQAKIAQIYNFFTNSSSSSMIHLEMYGKGTPST